MLSGPRLFFVSYTHKPCPSLKIVHFPVQVRGGGMPGKRAPVKTCPKGVALKQWRRELLYISGQAAIRHGNKLMHMACIYSSSPGHICMGKDGVCPGQKDQ